MIGMNMKRRKCGDCTNINLSAYGPRTPVCYRVCDNKDRPVATAVTITDKRAEFCGFYREREEKQS